MFLCHLIGRMTTYSPACSRSPLYDFISPFGLLLSTNITYSTSFHCGNAFHYISYSSSSFNCLIGALVPQAYTQHGFFSARWYIIILILHLFVSVVATTIFWDLLENRGSSQYHLICIGRPRQSDSSIKSLSEASSIFFYAALVLIFRSSLFYLFSVCLRAIS